MLSSVFPRLSKYSRSGAELVKRFAFFSFLFCNDVLMCLSGLLNKDDVDDDDF